MKLQFQSFFPLSLTNSAILMEKISDTLNLMNQQQQQQSELKRQDDTISDLPCLEGIEVPQRCREKHSNFSIDYILGIDEDKESQSERGDVQYDWLNYTRYKPPKLQRIRKKTCVQRRRLGRNPRIPFSSEQVTILEEKFQISPYLSNADVAELSKGLQLSESRIKIWFQNRRARERRDIHDSSKKGIDLIKSFLMKTRHTDVASEIQDLSMSAFKPCHNFLK